MRTANGDSHRTVDNRVSIGIGEAKPCDNIDGDSLGVSDSREGNGGYSASEGSEAGGKGKKDENKP